MVWNGFVVLCRRCQEMNCVTWLLWVVWRHDPAADGSQWESCAAPLWKSCCLHQRRGRANFGCNWICARWCKIMQDDARQCMMMLGGARQCKNARWCATSECKTAQDDARWCHTQQHGTELFGAIYVWFSITKWNSICHTRHHGTELFLHITILICALNVCKILGGGALIISWKWKCSFIHISRGFCVQDDARRCKMMQDDARECKIIQDDARCCKMMQDNAGQCKMMQRGLDLCDIC